MGTRISIISLAGPLLSFVKADNQLCTTSALFGRTLLHLHKAPQLVNQQFVQSLLQIPHNIESPMVFITLGTRDSRDNFERPARRRPVFVISCIGILQYGLGERSPVTVLIQYYLYFGERFFFSSLMGLLLVVFPIGRSSAIRSCERRNKYQVMAGEYLPPTGSGRSTFQSHDSKRCAGENV